MDAIEIRPNFSASTSRFSPQDLYSNKRAKLGNGKFNAINKIYDKFLASLSVPSEEENPLEVYRDVQKKHGLTVFVHDIKKSIAEGAKKLRVGEVVETASVKFSDAVAVERPVEVVSKPTPVVEVKETPKPVIEETKVEEEPMSRTKRHEDTMPIYSEPTTREVADDISSRRLDSYLSKGLDSNIEQEQSIDKLAAKISEINAIKEKTSDLQAKQDELLAEEEEMDKELARAFEDADKDLLSATQSLDKIIESINDTKGRLAEKRRMLEKLNKVR